MFDHVTIKVNDLQSSRAFYETVLRELGYGVVLEVKGFAVGFETHTHDMFEITQASAASPVSSAVHVAFAAKSEEAVQAFHSTAMANGGKNNGAPGLRKYEDGYYAAFVIDPNGHNLEAVFVKRD